MLISTRQFLFVDLIEEGTIIADYAVVRRRAMPKFSVIIPAFNAEKTIGQLLNMIKQYHDLQIIVVDDGSTDNTRGVVADVVKETSASILYIHQNNKGPSAARNKGIEVSTGEYVVFLDSDDLPENNFIKTYEKCIDKKVDCVIGDYFKIVDDDNENAVLFHNNPGIYDAVTVSKAFFKNEVYISLWNTAFKRKIIVDNNLSFDESLRSGEDVVFIARFLSCSDSAFFVNQIVYRFYYSSQRSLQRQATYTINRINESIYYKLAEYYETIKYDLETQNIVLFYRLATISLRRMMRIAYETDKYSEFRKEIKKNSEFVYNALQLQRFDVSFQNYLKRKTVCLLLKYSPFLFYLVSKKIYRSLFTR